MKKFLLLFILLFGCYNPQLMKGRFKDFEKIVTLNGEGEVTKYRIKIDNGAFSYNWIEISSKEFSILNYDCYVEVNK